LVGLFYAQSHLRFLGKENALKEEALDDLKRKVLSGANADLNYTLFYADQIEPREFQDAVIPSRS